MNTQTSDESTDFINELRQMRKNIRNELKPLIKEVLLKVKNSLERDWRYAKHLK